MKFLRSLVCAAGLMIAATDAFAADKLTVLLDWFVNPDHAPLVIAREGGYFAAHGLDVDLVAPADPSAPPRLVAAGQAEIALHYQPSLTLDVEAGLPLVRFGALIETPLNTLIVLKDGPVKQLSDLKGKKIGYSVSGFEDAMLGQFLKKANLSLSDVELVNVNFALSSSLLAGQVDAVIGGYRNFELNQMKIEGHEGRAFFPEENGVPAYDELTYVTNKALIGDKRLPAFLQAVEEATLFLTNHPDDAWAMFVKAYPDLNDDLNRRAWVDTLPRFAKTPGALQADRYTRFAQFMKDAGLIKSVPVTDTYAVELRSSE
ncbi:ABC transporter substrate-binding protein [Oryzibacter oryziterrae]|uniref:ABC transporter substrate-binding protein n=1 Tax=Oryzibacter oryziterrae TaxID=2766474 RepID=UPI001F48EB9D|nr:ABC transporter substrate-binding protein [Oryzibacter oryziterrae]